MKFTIESILTTSGIVDHESYADNTELLLPCKEGTSKQIHTARPLTVRLEI